MTAHLVFDVHNNRMAEHHISIRLVSVRMEDSTVQRAPRLISR